jgi:radical SAM/Cys-rich protein
MEAAEKKMLSSQISEELLEACPKETAGIVPFSSTLSTHGLTLTRDVTRTLQINTGLLCNQACRHCHLDAGPGRKENMHADTVREVLSYARRGRFETVDITGGAPELNPNIENLIKGASSLAPRIMLRSNLSVLNDGKREGLIELLTSLRVVIVSSFPSLNELQADAQRGGGVFEASINALKKLNQIGYGHDGTGLELNLVSNPTGAFLPPSQTATEDRFRNVLKKKWGIVFNSLFSFANVPLGRFRRWLLESGNYEGYMDRLYARFNPCAVDAVMCRTLVSVSWDGYLYDCDFNLARGLHMGGRRVHVSEMPGPPEEGTHIATADHCYTCTAGAGFT